MSVNLPQVLVPGFHNQAANLGDDNLRLHKHQINEEHDKVVLNIFIREALAARTLRQPDISS